MPTEAIEAPATEAAAPTSAAPAAPTPSEPATPDPSAAAEDAWLKSNPADGSAPAATEPTDSETDDDAPADPEADPAEAPEPAALSDDEVKVLKRFKLNPESAAVKSLPPEERASFINSLRSRAAYTDGLQRKLTQYEQGQTPGNTGTPPAEPEGEPLDDPDATDEAKPAPAKPQQPATPDDAFKALGDYFGDPEAAATFKSTFDAALAAAVQPQLAQVDGFLRQLVSRMVEDDFAHAFNELELPDGVDKNDPKVQEELRQLAWQLMEKDFDPIKFNPRHALPLAATHKYQAKIIAAQRQLKQQRSKKALAGSPEASPRMPTTATKLTEAQMEDLALAGVNKGLTGEALSRYVQSGGRTH